MMKNKRGWIKIVEAFIAVFIIMSVALFVINKSYIERRDISEKIYGVEIQLLQEIIDKFGKIKFNDPLNSPGENEIDDFINGEEGYTNRRVPEYLECGIGTWGTTQNWFFSKTSPEDRDVYAQTLPIVETETSIRIECWIK